MNINERIYKSKYTQENFEIQMDRMQDYCVANNLCLDDGEDNNGYYVVIHEQQLPTPEEIKASLLQAVDNYLNSTVQAKGYDSILSACSYAFDETDEVFAEEGKKALAFRSGVYRTCYNILAEVEAGERDIPTEEELLAELPVLEW